MQCFINFVTVNVRKPGLLQQYYIHLCTNSIQVSNVAVLAILLPDVRTEVLVDAQLSFSVHDFVAGLGKR